MPAVMGHWKSWHVREPGRHAGIRRAGVKALALLALTVAAAVVLTVLYHLPWQPVVVTILLLVPALYVAWLAVPGVISVARRSAFGRLPSRWDPVELGVHRVIGGGPMPPYVRRPHDNLLRAVLDPAVPASRLVVVRGGSSTGKTRAAYEAVVDQLANWRLDYPLDPGALKERLDAGVPARTVLWLGELRQYVDVDGGAEVLGRLADLLDGEGRAVITTVWPEQSETYANAARAGSGAADPAGTAGRLLARLPELTDSDPARIDPVLGGIIDVPDRFTTADLEAAVGTGDPVLVEAAEAAASAGQEGQVAQYLAGVPDLLDRYAGPGGDPYGQAIITAAMDATRLGHASPLSAALLQEAAVGYLTGPQRTNDITTWRDTALAWARKELKGAVRALQPVPPPSGTGVVGYQVADYLWQYGRRTRQDQLGPPSLWDALTAHAFSVSDLTRLGQAARDRGLYRHAAALWTTAAALGGADAAGMLIAHVRNISPGDSAHVAQWAAGRAGLDEPHHVARLLGFLRQIGADDAVGALLARDPTGQVTLEYPSTVAWLLKELREAGADDAVRALLARDPAGQVTLDYPMYIVAPLLLELREAGADDAARALAIRAAGLVNLNDPLDVTRRLEMLGMAAADDSARTLATLAAGQVSLDNPGDVAELLEGSRQVGADDAVRVLLARDPAGHASLDKLSDVAFLLERLRAAGADDAARALAARAADQVSLNDPDDVASLLKRLCEAGADDAARILATRAAEQVSLGGLRNPANLLDELREAGAHDAARTLAARAADHSSRDKPDVVKDWPDMLVWFADHILRSDRPRGLGTTLRLLRSAGADDAASALAARAASQADFDKPAIGAQLLRELREAGADDAARVLLARDPAGHASLDNPGDVASLLTGLREAGADDAARTLATRAANAGMFDLFLKAYPDEASRYPYGREPDRTPSQSWKWQQPTSQDLPGLSVQRHDNVSAASRDVRNTSFWVGLGQLGSVSLCLRRPSRLMPTPGRVFHLLAVHDPAMRSPASPRPR
jgi:hypothetical protein